MAQPGGDLAQRGEAVGLLQLFAQDRRLLVHLRRRTRGPPPLPHHAAGRQQAQQRQSGHPSQPPIGHRRRQARGRIGEQVQFPTGWRNRPDMLDHADGRTRHTSGGQHQRGDLFHPKPQGILPGISGDDRGACAFTGNGALGCAEPPLGIAAEQHDPVGIGDKHPGFGIAPFAFETVKFHLDRDHAERAIRRADPLRQIQAGAPADGAQGKFARPAIAQGSGKIAAKAVIRSDEAVGPVPIAGGQRLPARIHQVNRRRIGLLRQCRQPPVEHCELASFIGQQRGDFGINRQHARHQREFVELAFQPGGKDCSVIGGRRAGFGHRLHTHCPVQPDHRQRRDHQHTAQRDRPQVPAFAPAVHDGRFPLPLVVKSPPVVRKSAREARDLCGFPHKAAGWQAQSIEIGTKASAARSPCGAVAAR